MALFAFFLSAALGGGGVVALRERPKQAAIIGLVATTCCLLAAILMPTNASLGVGSTVLEAGTYARLFLVAAALALLVSQVAGLAHGWQRELPLATLGALGLVGIALTVSTPAAAMLTVAAAGTFVVIASLERAISMPAVRAAASGFRLAVIAGFMGLVAMAITGLDPIFVAPDVLAGATLLMAAAVAIRVGAIPVHAPVARLIERARTAALPLLAAWVPAAFAVVALGWTSAIVALGATTPIVVVVVAVGVLTIALASAVVVIDDDLIRWLGYGLIADGGFVLLALSGDSTSAISAGLAWLICFAIARSIMACVLLGLQGAFDARRTRELEGWLRRMPLLGLALLASLLVAFGLPGTLSWQVRLDLAQSALGDQLGLALVAVALLPLVPVARLIWTGIRPLGIIVAAGGSERFAAPPRMEDAVGTSATDSQSSNLDATAGELPSPATSDSTEAAQASALTSEPAGATEALATAPEPAVAPEALATVPGPMPGAVPRVTLEPAAASATVGGATVGGPATEMIWASQPGTGSLWAAETGSNGDDAASGSGSAGQPSAGAESEAPPPAPGSVGVQEPSPPPAPTRPAEVPTAPTLSSSGRAARAARRASQPTIAGRASPDEPEAPTVGAAAAGPGSTPSPRTPRWAPASAWVRSRSASMAASAGPVRHALRDLPAIWALDRTLIASLATLVLALVGLAFATDLVGLGSAAGLATASTPGPGTSPAP